MFEGVDNDGDKDVDEDGYVPDSGTGCPPTRDNDPNCGRATLDNITAYVCGSGTTESAVAFIVNRYGLSSQYLKDPWGKTYEWCRDDTKPLRYHKFWSSGPDETKATSDDIVY